jgi:hypothetical protein
MWRSFLEHLKPLAAHRWCMTGETGDISARASKKATADRVADRAATPPPRRRRAA